MTNLVLLKYELYRLILTKKYFYMALLLTIWTIDILMRLVIDGFSSTAPFSEWSYTLFITLFAPILLVILILLCTSIFSEKEETVRNIIYSTPLSETKYYIMKGSAVALVFIITAAIPIIISFVYYAFLFEYTEYLNFILPILLFLIPSSIFIFGLSIALGKINVKLLYVLIPLTFVLGIINLRILPVWLDVFGNDYLEECAIDFYNSNMEIIPYNIPSDFIYSRLIFAALGILLFLFACKHNSDQK